MKFLEVMSMFIMLFGIYQEADGVSDRLYRRQSQYQRYAPQFIQPPPPFHEVKLGASLNITCSAVGSPTPFVKWRKEPGIDMPEAGIQYGTNVLQLTDIQEDADYTCIAANRWTTTEVATMVRLQSPPQPPENLQVSKLTSTSVRLSWSYYGRNELRYFVIYYKPSNTMWPYSEISEVLTTYYNIEKLIPNTDYEFLVVGLNAVGRGQPSAPTFVKTG